MTPSGAAAPLPFPGRFRGSPGSFARLVLRAAAAAESAASSAAIRSAVGSARHSRRCASCASRAIGRLQLRHCTSSSTCSSGKKALRMLTCGRGGASRDRQNCSQPCGHGFCSSGSAAATAHDVNGSLRPTRRRRRLRRRRRGAAPPNRGRGPRRWLMLSPLGLRLAPAGAPPDARAVVDADAACRSRRLPPPAVRRAISPACATSVHRAPSNCSHQHPRCPARASTPTCASARKSTSRSAR